MDISLFDYELNSNLIAQKPCVPRDNSRLLNCTKEVAEDLRFKDLPSILNSGDVLVINNTKVIPSRLFGKRDKVNVEVTLHMKTNKNTWRAFLKPGRKCKINDTILFQNNLKAKVIEKYVEGDVLLYFNKNDQNVLKDVNHQGQMPLPPYIKRNKKNESDDKDYQTVFAEQRGAVAAPTAGLHFTEGLIGRIHKKGAKTAHTTLHIGLGTFRPVQVEDLNRHQMDSEYFEVSPQTALLINETKKKRKKVFAVGTSTVRSLETVAVSGFQVSPKRGWTDKFIYPPYEYKMVDRVITNFHSPQSTLLMMVSAFAGRKLIKKAYLEAKKNDYRFLSYGDAMIII